MRAVLLTAGLLCAAALAAGFSTPMELGRAGMAAPEAGYSMPSQDVQDDWNVDDEAPGMDTCRNCGSGSTGACAGAQQCRGTEKECRAKGCKDTGYSSCSTAANVKKC